MGISSYGNSNSSCPIESKIKAPSEGISRKVASRALNFNPTNSKRCVKNVKVAIWDVETSNLKPDFAVMLCAGVKPYGKEPVMLWKGRNGVNDKKLVKSVKDELEKYDILVSYYGLGFDLKFLNSRLLYWGYEPVKERFHIDVYRIARKLFNITPRRLATVSYFLKIEGKDHVEGETWMRAALEGDKRAIEAIVDHCKRDTEVLEKVFDRVKGTLRSISRV